MDERIERWSADFAETTAFALLPGPLKEHAVGICTAFLHGACEHPGLAPDQLNEEAVRHAMLDHMPALDLPAEVRPEIPTVVSAFLQSLEETGRLAGGSTLAKHVTVLSKSFQDRCASGGGVRTPPVRNTAPKISRNDPCPCGSGKKFKKCCSK